jgi:cell shape-determining protein MreC
MKYISNDDEVKVGERVVTSGMDRIFPRDLPVGTITEVKQGPPPFKLIRVRPSAELEKLEEVIVLLTTSPIMMKKAPEDTGGSESSNPSGPAAKEAVAKPVAGKRAQEPQAKNPDKPR